MAEEIKFRGKTLDPETTRAIADDVLVQGARPVEWWRRQGTQLHAKFMDTVRQSMEAGEGIDKMRKRIGGGVIGGVQVPGIMKAAKHNAEALARTAVNKVTNEARLRTFEKNTDTIKGVKQVSTLDNRTSVICAAYDGKAWKIPGYKPIPPTTLPFNGGPPRHFNCRSTLVPILKSWKELGLPFDELKPSTRASMDGQIPADQTFDAFLKKKGLAFQVKLLGETRARLWRNGKISLQEMLDFRGQPITPEQLAQIAKQKRKVKPRPAPPKPAVKPAQPAKPKPAPKPAAAPTPAGPAPDAPVKVVNPGAKPAERKWHAKSWFQGTPDYLQAAIAKAQPLKTVRTNTTGSYYQPKHSVADVFISMDKRPGVDSLRAKGTWRHEYGHHLDWTYAKKRLSPEQLKETGGHISATFSKELAKDADDIIKNVDIQKGIAWQKKLYRDAFDSGDPVDYLDKRLRKYGFTYDEMAKLHKANLNFEDPIDSPAMQRIMAHVITALRNKDMHHYLVQVWWKRSQYGIGGKIADFYGSMTRVPGSGPKVGWGHSEMYYSKRSKYGAQTEAMANVLAIMGAEPQWRRFIEQFGGMRFFNKIEQLLKDEAK